MAGLRLPLKFRRWEAARRRGNLRAFRCPSFATVRPCHPILPNSTRASRTGDSRADPGRICAKGTSYHPGLPR